jgi:hypothetical protein
MVITVLVVTDVITNMVITDVVTLVLVICFDDSDQNWGISHCHMSSDSR